MNEAELHKALDERNAATKLWIQAETQTRNYCHSLEKEIAKLEAIIKSDTQRLHKQYITCVYCGTVLHTIERMAETKVMPTLDCLKCRRPHGR